MRMIAIYASIGSMLATTGLVLQQFEDSVPSVETNLVTILDDLRAGESVDVLIPGVPEAITIEMDFADWTTLTPGQIVEFTLPGGWWHEGVFESSELPLMKSGDAKYCAFVAKVDTTEGIWLAVSMTQNLPVEFGQVLTIPANLASTVSFTIQAPEVP